MIDPRHPYHRTLGALNRRQLLNIAWKIGAAAVAAPVATTTVRGQMAFDAYPFPLGVASGDPWPRSVVLWTRLAPKPLEGGGMPMASIEVAWELAADRGFTKIVRNGTSLARPELGHSVHVEATGLESGREYFYRFRVGREVSQTGRTKTAPAEGVAVDRLRFAVCGCNHYETGHFTAFRHIAAENFDFVFHTGDYIYEGRDDGGQNVRVRNHTGQEIYTLVDYRNRYAQYKMDHDFRAAHASAPFIITWDDHEVDNDYSGATDEQNTPPELFLLRRAAAYQAFFESMPVREALLPRGPDLLLYRRLKFGSLIDFSVLDTRQYRSNQPCEGLKTLDCPEFRDPARTMLGASQEKWLFDGLASSRSTWTVIGQQVPTFARDFGPENPASRFSVDKWDGYGAARDRLFTRLVDSQAPNPVILSGDVHVHYASDLRRDFTKPETPVIGVELTNTSVTSGGDGSAVAANWADLQQRNPHLKYHSNRRGYIAVTATPGTLTAEFKVVEKVSVPGEPLRTDGKFVVAAGHPALQAG